MLETDLQKVDWNTNISKLPKKHDVISKKISNNIKNKAI